MSKFKFEDMDADDRLRLHMEMLQHIRDSYDEFGNKGDSRPTIDDLIEAMDTVIELEETVEHYYEDRVGWVVADRLEWVVASREGKTVTVQYDEEPVGTLFIMDPSKTQTTFDLNPDKWFVQVGEATVDGVDESVRSDDVAYYVNEYHKDWYGPYEIRLQEEDNEDK